MFHLVSFFRHRIIHDQASIGNLVNTAAQVTAQRAATVKTLQDQLTAQKQAQDAQLKAQVQADLAYQAAAAACNCTPPSPAPTAVTASTSTSASLNSLIASQDQVTRELAAMYVPALSNSSDIAVFLRRVDIEMTITGRTKFLPCMLEVKFKSALLSKY